MAINIKFDLAGNPEPPTIILANRNGNKLGQLDVNAKSIDLSDKFNDVSELSFTVNKYIDGELAPLWDKIKDFKLIWCKEWDLWMEITVELDEETETVKTVFCTQLGQAELSQIMLYNIHINEEGDPNWNTENKEYKSTILYDPENTDVSLLHRLLKDKAPHYSIEHVDDTIKNIQRSFSFDGTSICDAFEEIAEEIGCLFVYNSNSDENDKIKRTISVYDLWQKCKDCGHRGEFTDKCPKCGSQNIKQGYGTDTLIFVTSDELASEGIQLTTDTDAVKNCFKLETGDDLMTATVRNCNPNGTDYLWHFSDTMKEDMSEELIKGIDDYDVKYRDYYSSYESKLNKDSVTQYNNLVEKYKDYYNTKSTCLNADCKNEAVFDGNCPKCGSSNILSGKSLHTIPETIIGYPALMNAYYDTIDLALYLKSSLMPDVELTEKSLCSDCNYEGVFKNTCPQCNSTNILSGAKYQASLLTTSALSPVAVNNEHTESITKTTADSAVLSMAKIIVKSTYKVEIKSSNYDEDTNFWSGKFVITNHSDENDTATIQVYRVIVNNDTKTFIKQKIDKALNKDDTDDYSVSSLFKFKEVEDNNSETFEFEKELIVTVINNEKVYSGAFYDELKKYALNPLKSFHDACVNCLDILIEQGSGNEDEKLDLYRNLYLPYRDRRDAINKEISVRENEIDIIEGLWDKSNENNPELIVKGLQQYIEESRNTIQKELDFENYLGKELWLELCSYRREDTYSNDNYISDGLNNAQLFKRASEFYEVAENEIYKSAELQHSISTSLNNLLAIDKFKPLVKSFKVGNWIRVRIDDNIYKLRLLEYNIDFGSFENISVEFSNVTKIKNGITDVESVLSQASSMATSYSSVQRQASQGEKSNNTLEDWVNNGLNATNTKIIGTENQNQVWDKNGILCREYDSITGTYSDEQLKIINSTIAITDNNWETTKTAIGKFYYIDQDKNSETYGKLISAYGVNGETIVGKLLIGEQLNISNDDNSLEFGKEGLIVKDETNTIAISPSSNESIINIKKNSDNIFSINEDGDLVIVGKITLLDGSTINSSSLEGLSDVALSGDYNDLKNTPKLATVATSGDYNDLKNLPDNILNNKTVVLLGDSNAYYWAETNPFEKISPKTNFISYATSGATWNTSATNNILEQLNKITTAPDYIILWCGGNDTTKYFPNFGISNIGQAVNGSGKETIPAMQHVLYQIRKKFPLCKVLGIIRNNKSSQDTNRQNFLYHYIEHVYRDFSVPYIDFDLVGNITDSVTECHNANYRDGIHYNNAALSFITNQIIHLMRGGMSTSPLRPCSYYWCSDEAIGENNAQLYAWNNLCSPRNGIHGLVYYKTSDTSDTYRYFQIEGNQQRHIVTENGTASLRVRGKSGVDGKTIMKYAYDTAETLNVNNMCEGIHYFANGCTSNLTGLPSEYNGTVAISIEIYTNNANGNRMLRMQDWQNNLWVGHCTLNGIPSWKQL